MNVPQTTEDVSIFARILSEVMHALVITDLYCMRIFTIAKKEAVVTR